MKFHRYLYGFCLLAAVLMAIPGWAADRQVRVTSGGGVMQDSEREAIFKPFTQKTGIKVIEDTYDFELSKVKAMVKAKNVTWDVIHGSAEDVIRGCAEGLFVKLDWSKIGGKNQLMPGAAIDCGAGCEVWSMVLAYNADKIKDPPKNWKEFWDVKKYPVKRSMMKRPYYTMEIALLADGVPPAKIYEVLKTKEGVDRAFRKLDQIKPYVQWWEAGAQVPEWMASGDVLMAAAYNGRIYNAIKAGKNFAINWDGQLYMIDYWATISGTPNLNEAYEFVKFAITKDPQIKFAELIPYGPTNKAAISAMPAKVAANLPNAPEHMKNALRYVPEFWADRAEELLERFNAWASK